MSQILQSVTSSKVPEALSRTNLTKLALVAVFLTFLDTVQSYYGQKVVNVFTEFNNLPAIYYNHGLAGYIMYAPIEFGAIFVTVAGLWIWASFLMWYCRNVLAKIRFPARSRNPQRF